MIRAIVAIDNKRGLADDKGIPWDLPTDIKHYRTNTLKGKILMGYNTYKEFDRPFHDRVNYVANISTVPLRPGFKLVKDACEFLKKQTGDIWVIGGAGLLAQTMYLIDELYITQLQGYYGTTKFFPEYKNDFKLVSESEPITENGITYTFQIWKRK